MYAIRSYYELEIDDIEFSYPSGFYSNNFSLQISHPDPEYRILYTVDGSNPVYSGTRIAGGYGQTVTVNINPASTYSGVRGLTPVITSYSIHYTKLYDCRSALSLRTFRNSRNRINRYATQLYHIVFA